MNDEQAIRFRLAKLLIQLTRIQAEGNDHARAIATEALVWTDDDAGKAHEADLRQRLSVHACRYELRRTDPHGGGVDRPAEWYVRDAKGFTIGSGEAAMPPWLTLDDVETWLGGQYVSLAGVDVPALKRRVKALEEDRDGFGLVPAEETELARGKQTLARLGVHLDG